MTPRSELASAPRPGPVRAGFTLVELLIAVTLGGMVMAAAFGILNSQQESVRTDELRRELQQNSRYALDLLRRDLQEAGEAMDPAAEFGVVAMGDGGGSRPDTLYLLFIEPETPTHDAEAPASSSGFEQDSARLTIRCNDDVDDVEEGSFLYFASSTERGIAVVRGVDREITDTCDPGDPPSEPIGVVKLGIEPVDGESHGWILQGNQAGAGVVRARAVAYYVDDSDADDPRLMRATRYRPDGTWQGRPLADGVNDLQLGLVFADGVTRQGADGTDGNPDNDYDDINSVEIRLTTQARRVDKDVAGGERLERNYAMTVSPRNQIYTRNLDN